MNPRGNLPLPIRWGEGWGEGFMGRSRPSEVIRAYPRPSAPIRGYSRFQLLRSEGKQRGSHLNICQITAVHGDSIGATNNKRSVTGQGRCLQRHNRLTGVAPFLRLRCGSDLNFMPYLPRCCPESFRVGARGGEGVFTNANPESPSRDTSEEPNDWVLRDPEYGWKRTDTVRPTENCARKETPLHSRHV